MQKLWTRPAANRLDPGKSEVEGKPRKRAGDHGPRRPDSRAVRRHRDRTEQGAGGEARDQPAQAGLAKPVDVARNVGEERTHKRIGRKVDEKGQQHHGAHDRRRPDIDKAFLERLQRRAVRRRFAEQPDALDADAECQHEACRVHGAHRHVGKARTQGGDECRARECPHDARRVGGGARYRHCTHQVVGRHGLADQQVAQRDIGGAHEADHGGEDEHRRRSGKSGEKEHHQRQRDRDISRPHQAEQVAVADAVAHHAVCR